MQGLAVINKGFLCLIQDLGRQGVGHLGLSQGGALDRHSYCWANKLLNNHNNASVIEITMGGASFSAVTDMTMAITGANMFATIDNKPQSNWRSFYLRKGQTLNLDFAQQGVRAYLAVKGGFNTPAIVQSQSTVMRNQLGGIPSKGQNIGTGSALKVGDIIHINHQCLSNAGFNQVPIQYQKHYSGNIKLDLIESYQAQLFSNQAKALFYQQQYQVSLQSDRMGVRLNGPRIEHQIPELISEGIASGSVQIPPNGQPIILLNDRQTLGGYAKIGCITRISQNRLAQARPDDIVIFNPTTIEQATKQWQQFLSFFDE